MPKPAGLMTRARAEAALDATFEGEWRGGLAEIGAVLDALDRAGAFGDEATLAEIADAAREILIKEHGGPQIGAPSVSGPMGRLALRLATACRKAGLVKP